MFVEVFVRHLMEGCMLLFVQGLFGHYLAKIGKNMRETAL